MSKSEGPLPPLVKAFSDIDTSGKVTTQHFVDAIAKTFPFFDHLGTVFYFAKNEMEQKRETLVQAIKSCPTLDDVVAKDKQDKTATVKNSCTRNLHRLLYAVSFISELLSQLTKTANANMRTAAFEAYAQTLSNIHPFLVRTGVKASIYMLPTRESFMQSIGETDESTKAQAAELAPVAKKLVMKVESLFTGINMPKSEGTNWSATPNADTSKPSATAASTPTKAPETAAAEPAKPAAKDGGRGDLGFQSGQSSMAFMFTKPGNKRYWIGGASVLAVILLGVAFLSIGRGPSMQSTNLPQQVSRIPTARLNSGHEIPLLGWGSFMITGDKCREATKSAVQAGYRHIDTAITYGNEAEVGDGLRPHLESGDVNREDLFVTTKLWSDQHAKDAVEPALRESLRKLKLDYVDLFLVHWPITDQHGATLQPPMQETWEGMQDVVDQGLAKSIGVSNFSPEKIEEWFSGARMYPAVNQVEIHPHWRNDRTIKFCKEKGIHVTAYAPLSSPANMDSFPNDLKDPAVLDVAASTGKTPAQVLLRWGLQHGGSIIPKSSSVAHQKENLGAVGWELAEDDFAAVSNISSQMRYFEGQEMAYNSEGPWHSYEELWNEPMSPDQP
ncbi:hypothetical protein WJX84_000733 [Apatococcus fuscideae]|uniref:Uncharacterized protein n=1 Tax=Apatococcus fuscideae TaxID=2026836 RepID=A0AAW1TE36_9CHLO